MDVQLKYKGYFPYPEAPPKGASGWGIILLTYMELELMFNSSTLKYMELELMFNSNAFKYMVQDSWSTQMLLNTWYRIHGQLKYFKYMVQDSWSTQVL